MILRNLRSLFGERHKMDLLPEIKLIDAEGNRLATLIM